MELLATHLLEVGPAVASDMGLQKVSWTEFKAWLDVTEPFLNVWQCQTIMAASSVYVAAVAEYREKLIDAPYVRELTEEECLIEEAEADRRIEATIDKAWIERKSNAG